MNPELVWLRDDLRLADNPLFHFDSPPGSLMCVYVLDERWLSPLAPGLSSRRIGAARLCFLWQSLIALRGELLKRGGDLLVRVGDPPTVIAELTASVGVLRIHVRDAAGHDEATDLTRLTEQLPESCNLRRCQGDTLFDDQALPFALEDLPGSFSAFRRRMEAESSVPPAQPAPITLPLWPEKAPRGLPPLKDVCEEAAAWRPDPRGDFRFQGGEEAAQARLDHYLWHSGAIARYKKTRNGLLGAEFSTRLSPWLATGCLSARQVHDQVRTWELDHGACESSYWVIFELMWREYFHWVARKEGGLLFGPRTLPEPPPAFHDWCRGETGVPFIDAGMRELASTGWQSNRMRQNVASFLVHDLGIDWRLGAAWFEHCLIDFDVASNWGNWGYVAGVGREASRGRYFNVLWQAQHYDPAGDYVSHWRPELERLAEGEARHQPWRAAPDAFPAPCVIPDAWGDALMALPSSTGDSSLVDSAAVDTPPFDAARET
ncbi:deoxyribodipyrimidine photo-lyase (single-stranded DNA-specific) [Onishia taeanensis]|uniref:Cryptochrome DASH n=1 Tax=Onishia taeanensis TaxID=284577 RepID=A0A328XY83_9GAMM|nr:DASH family cryptochrome [Halomonas taeanensis]RAR63375.1 deoxyribodipyrimidine photo-lyase (single-stranded DNA-specific) [Halomonas taeanensis]